MIAQQTARHEPYAWHWLAFIALVFFGGGILLYRGPQIPSFQSSRSVTAADENHSYYVIHMPAIPAGDMLLEKRAEAWLVSMATKGYRPMLLSEVHRRLSQRESLPEKTVVLMFDPGYRQTLDAMAPLLAKYKYPAVWVTDKDSMSNRDRRYVSARVLEAMRKSGVWDTAYYKGHSLVVDTPEGKELVIGAEKGVWRPSAGRRASNEGVPHEALNRLHVSWNWTEHQMIDRLRAEEPLRGNGYLTIKTIANHNWGVVLPLASKEIPEFGVKAPIEGRTANISWLGTKGLENLDLNLDVRTLSGEMWVLMRSDDEIGDNVGVCFGNGNVTVGEHQHGQFLQRASVQWPSMRQPASFSARVVLQGQRLSVYVDGRPVLQVNSVFTPSSKEGMVRLTLYDKILGGAQVESVKIKATDLGNNSKEEQL